MKYGLLTYLKDDGYKIEPSGNKRKMVLCQCDCGTIKSVSLSNLRYNKIKSCGCLKSKLLIIKNTTHNNSITNNRTLTYNSWACMIQRCTNPKNHKYEIYGGRGITICDRWKKFENFLEDMGQRPTNTTIDRINVNGNYEPSNCRWATPKQQNNNKR